MSQNVQQYSKSVYLRASEAQQCKVQSTLVVPLFDGNDRHQPCGVLEVVQAVQDMRFDNVMQTLASVLQVGSCNAIFAAVEAAPCCSLVIIFFTDTAEPPGASRHAQLC